MSPQLFCECCHMQFKTKTNYNRHLETRRHNQLASNITTYVCACGKKYTYPQSLYGHRRSCAVYQNSKDNNVEPEPTGMQEMKQRLDQYEKEREEMKAQIAMLLESHGTSSGNTTNIDTQNNIENQNIEQTINININAFGKENVDYLDDAAIADCIGRVYKSVPAILREIHFNPEHPENHNIKITNRKLPYASVMGNDQTWKIMNKKEAIETMVYNGYNLLDEKYPETKNKLSSRRQQHFEGFQDKFLSEDKDLVKQVKNDVEIMILNGASAHQETDS